MKPVAEKGIPISQSDPSFPASVEETLKTRLTQIQARLDASSSVEERPDGFSYVPEFIQLSQAKDDLAFLVAALLASETQQQWQPIETAPKDGDWFLGGWWSPSVFEGEEEHPWFEWNRCRWADYEDERGGYFYSASGGIPTHWLPLSSPPASEKG